MISEGQIINGFILEKMGNIPFINEYGYRFIHVKTGMKLYYFLDSDQIKSFDLVFDTPLLDDSGVRHIIEHSVLCGSKKYQSKDPFIDIKKGSLSTFMNAFTGIDKTSYLYTTSNEEDFFNLMDFYLDACFNPLCITDKRIFECEGCHYEFDDDGKLILNGVVYNEMKKMSSDKTRVIRESTFKDLYPGSFLTYNSGGDTKAIPKLSFEKFVSYYKKYYRPSNAYLILTGELDIEKALKLVNSYIKSYTSKRYEVSRDTSYQGVLDRYYVHPYPATENEVISKDETVKFIFKIDYFLSSYEEIIISLFPYLLTSNSTYSLKDVIVKAGLGKRVSAGFQPLYKGGYFAITVEGVKRENINMVREGMLSYFEDGIDQNALKDYLKIFRYEYFQNDIENYGLATSRKLSECLIENEDPFTVNVNEDCDYVLEDLSKPNEECQSAMLYKEIFNEAKMIILEFYPDGLYGERLDKNEKKRLNAKLKKLSEVDKANIRNNALALKEYRNRKIDEEVIKSIPKVDLKDLPREPKWPDGKVTSSGKKPLAIYKVNSRDITTIKFYFDIEGLTLEEIKILNIIKQLIFKTDTKKYSSMKMSSLSNKYFTDVNPALLLRSSGRNDFCVEVSFENKYLNEVFGLIYEVFKYSTFMDKEVIKSLIKSFSNKMYTMFNHEPSRYVETMLRSTHDAEGFILSQINSVEYINYLGSLIEKMNNPNFDIGAPLRRVTKKIFSWDRISLTVFTNSDEIINGLPIKFTVLNCEICGRKRQDKPFGIVYPSPNTGIIINSLVNYVGVRYDFDKTSYSDNPLRLRVIANILRNTYLWDNVRLLGGAYGSLVNVSDRGSVTMISYRDPEYEKTLEVFKNAFEFLANFNEDIEPYIISTYGSAERYNSLYFEAERADNEIRNGVTKELYTKYLRDMLKMTSEDVRKFGRMLMNSEPSNVSIASNESNIISDRQRFNTVIKI